MKALVDSLTEAGETEALALLLARMRQAIHGKNWQPGKAPLKSPLRVKIQQ